VHAGISLLVFAVRANNQCEERSILPIVFGIQDWQDSWVTVGSETKASVFLQAELTRHVFPDTFASLIQLLLLQDLWELRPRMQETSGCETRIMPMQALSMVGS